MTFTKLTFFALVASLCEVTLAQSTGRVRTVVPVSLVEQCPPCNPSSGSTIEDLSALLLLTRALDSNNNNNNNNNKNDVCCVNTNNGIDVEGIITKLINALVFTTTQTAVRNNAGYGSDSCSNGGTIPTKGSNGGTSPTKGRNANSDEALLDLQLLGSGKDNVLLLDVANKKVLGVGLGNQDTSSGTGTSGTDGAVGGLLNGLL